MLPVTCAKRVPFAIPFFFREFSEHVGKNGMPSDFNASKAILLTKLTRYEYEKTHYPNLSEEKFAQRLAHKGSNYKSLLLKHDNHKKSVENVSSCLRDKGIDTKVVTRSDYTKELVDWADVIFTTGGDGTFLLGASQVLDKNKPVIGIISDPARSEGRLCLSKALSFNFKEALEHLLNGQFRWKWRQRIRVTLTCRRSDAEGMEFHEQQLNLPELRFVEHLVEHIRSRRQADENDEPEVTAMLPVRALNEVFIGETLSSRVSYYEISKDGSPCIKQKSSGVTVSTGTGSTSWHLNINRLQEQSAVEILNIANAESNCYIDVNSQRLVSRICQRYNDKLNFDSSELKMAFTIRDPIINSVFPPCEPRGFAKTMLIRSRCFDASLVVDGGLSFMFNDGAVVRLEILPEDALRTVIMPPSS